MQHPLCGRHDLAVDITDITDIVTDITDITTDRLFN